MAAAIIADFDALVGEWARHATAVVEQWPEHIAEAEPDWATLERISNVGKERRLAS